MSGIITILFRSSIARNMKCPPPVHKNSLQHLSNLPLPPNTTDVDAEASCCNK